jgi:hypothetical protein
VSIVIQGTSLAPLRAKQEYQIQAHWAKNSTGGQNTVTPEVLGPCLEPDISVGQFAQWTKNEKETVAVTISWRLEPDGNGTLFETYHIATCGAPDRHPGVFFSGNLDWAFRAANHIVEFNRDRDAVMAGLAFSSSPSSANYTPSQRGGTLATIPRSLGSGRGRTRLPRHGSPPSEPAARVSREQQQQQDRRRAQTSRLVQICRRHADDVFRSTGDTTEVVRALELSRMVAVSELQRQQQQQQQQQQQPQHRRIYGQDKE